MNKYRRLLVKIDLSAIIFSLDFSLWHIKTLFEWTTWTFLTEISLSYTIRNGKGETVIDSNDNRRAC